MATPPEARLDFARFQLGNALGLSRSGGSGGLGLAREDRYALNNPF